MVDGHKRLENEEPHGDVWEQSVRADGEQVCSLSMRDGAFHV